MHTTNNVPQSRCRVFLIYGELNEMGRWSKRRWRHAAEGLHFSLFSPHKQEKPVSVCHNTHKHTTTHCSKTQALAHMYHPLHLHAHFPLPPQTHTPIPPFSTRSHSPLQLTTKHTWVAPPPIHTYTHTGKSLGLDWTQLRTPSNEQPCALQSMQQVDRLHSGGPYVGMNMHGNLSYRQQAIHIYDAKGHQREE